MKPENLLERSSLHAQKCTLNCPILDRFLGGGIPCNSITEITAESGAGKTQLCLQLLLSAQLPPPQGGLPASSLYLYTEFPFPLRRLRHLSLSFCATHFASASYDPLDYVFVHAVHSADHLLDVLSKLGSFLSGQNSGDWPVKLIVIDSIAAVFRSEFENTPVDLKRRSVLFFQVSGKLKALAKKFGLAVVVTNQVVDVVGSDEGGLNGLRVGNLGCLYTSGRRVCPALGLAWANCVNTRFFLSRSVENLVQNRGFVAESEGDSILSRTRRHIHVVFAPHLPPSSCEFQIVKDGVLGIDSNNGKIMNGKDQ